MTKIISYKCDFCGNEKFEDQVLGGIDPSTGEIKDICIDCHVKLQLDVCSECLDIVSTNDVDEDHRCNKCRENRNG